MVIKCVCSYKLSLAYLLLLMFGLRSNLRLLVFAVGDARTPSQFVITFSAQQIYPFHLSNKFSFSAGGSTVSAFVTKHNLIFSVTKCSFFSSARPTIEEKKGFPFLKTPPATSFPAILKEDAS